YELRVAGSVLLSVYDIQGREVARLVDGYRDAGVHEVTFDAAGLASGVYLYRLEAGTQQAVEKMVLLK
ncbi:T9SS type A sorting domain-containing protein, partial [bacterium]|nr:T9SS type A sorting domain-containing protein [bacterium]